MSQGCGTVSFSGVLGVCCAQAAARSPTSARSTLFTLPVSLRLTTLPSLLSLLHFPLFSLLSPQCRVVLSDISPNTLQSLHTQHLFICVPLLSPPPPNPPLRRDQTISRRVATPCQLAPVCSCIAHNDSHRLAYTLPGFSKRVSTSGSSRQSAFSTHLPLKRCTTRMSSYFLLPTQILTLS